MTNLFDNPIEVTSHHLDAEKGQVRKYQFKNGYGASVIRFRLVLPKKLEDLYKKQYPELAKKPSYGSYTKNEKEWELGVTYRDRLCYNTPITNDVIGWLKKDDVEAILGQIQDLPPKNLLTFIMDEIKYYYGKLLRKFHILKWKYQMKSERRAK